MATLKSPTLEEIAAKTDNLVNSIRDYARSQQELWRKVPWLALEADGRGGYNSTFALAYSRGFWPVHESIRDGYYQVVVDLATGELLDAQSTSEETFHVPIPKRPTYEPASIEDVLPFAASMDALDATRIIDMLDRQRKEPCFSHYNPKKQEEWREKTRKKHHVQEEYVRQSDKKR